MAKIGTLIGQLEFVLPICPTPQERPRFTRTGHAYHSAKQQARERELALALLPYRPKTPLQGPVVVLVHAKLPKPLKLPSGKKYWKPDVDNLAKQMLDALTRANFWHDDSQVVEISIRKTYSDTPPQWHVMILGEGEGENEQAS